MKSFERFIIYLSQTGNFLLHLKVLRIQLCSAGLFLFAVGGWRRIPLSFVLSYASEIKFQYVNIYFCPFAVSYTYFNHYDDDVDVVLLFVFWSFVVVLMFTSPFLNDSLLYAFLLKYPFLWCFDSELLWKNSLYIAHITLFLSPLQWMQQTDF